MGAAPAIPVVPSPARPLPIEEFGNPRLKDAVMKALEGVDEGHGYAALDVQNKGAGVMIAHRFEDVTVLGREVKWGVIFADRWNRGEGNEVQVTLAAQW